MPEEVNINIDQEECIGCAACETEALETFEMDDEPKVVIKDEPHDDKELIINAAENCPTECIVIKDKATGESLYPTE